MSPGRSNGATAIAKWSRAHARHRVLLARRLAQALADLAQQVVARLAAEGLVHQAEALDVDEDRRGEALFSPRGVQRLAHAVGEQAAVGQIGERVVVREVVHARLLREVVQREGDVAGQLVQQAHLLLVEEIALRARRGAAMPASSPPTSSGSATNEPLCASFQISERVPSLRRSRSRSALPSPAAATWRMVLPGPSTSPIAASRKPPFSTAMRQASSSSAWRSPARTMSALTALSTQGAVEALDAPLLRLERAGLLQQLVDHHAQVLLVEVRPAPAPALVARGERRVDLPQDLVVVGGLDQHARHAVRLGERLRVLAAEVRGVEHERRGARWPDRRCRRRASS